MCESLVSVLAAGLNRLPLSCVDLRELQLPPSGLTNVVAGLLYSAGLFTCSVTAILNLKLKTKDIYRVTPILIFYSLSWSFCWSVTCLIAGTLMHSLSRAHSRGVGVMFCVSLYSRLAASLSGFFFVFLVLTQCLSVVVTFLSLSKFLTKKNAGHEYLSFISNMILLGKTRGQTYLHN